MFKLNVFPFRAWTCGGRMEIVPCSKVGHIYKQKNVYSYPKGTKKTTGNLTEHGKEMPNPKEPPGNQLVRLKGPKQFSSTLTTKNRGSKIYFIGFLFNPSFFYFNVTKRFEHILPILKPTFFLLVKVPSFQPSFISRTSITFLPFPPGCLREKGGAAERACLPAPG